MPFQKQNKLGAQKQLKWDLDEQPICFKGWKGQKEKLKAVEGWQDKLRDYVDRLIGESKERL